MSKWTAWGAGASTYGFEALTLLAWHFQTSTARWEQSCSHQDLAFSTYISAILHKDLSLYEEYIVSVFDRYRSYQIFLRSDSI
jgi:hypothetical protein